MERTRSFYTHRKIMDRLSTEHLLGIKTLTTGDIALIMQVADNFKELINRPLKKVPSLRDVTVATFFLKIPPGGCDQLFKLTIFREEGRIPTRYGEQHSGDEG